MGSKEEGRGKRKEGKREERRRGKREEKKCCRLSDTPWARGPANFKWFGR